MRPEPGSRPIRKRRRYNESRPLSIRVGAIRDELDARSDGTESGYRAVIARDLKRWYQWLSDTLPEHQMAALEAACLYDDWCAQFYPMTHIAVIDALERAHILVTHAGLTVDAALVVVGLAKEEEK